MKKLFVTLSLLAVLGGEVSAQQFQVKEKPLSGVLEQIQKQTTYRLFWIPAEVEGMTVSVNADMKDMKSFMNELLKGTDLKCTFINDSYIHILKNKFLIDRMPAFAQWYAEKAVSEGSINNLLSDSKKADSENKIYVIGNKEKVSDEDMVEVRGVITSFKTGEPMMGVNMVIKEPKWSAAVSGLDGDYVLRVPKGQVEVEISGMGIMDTRRRLMVYDAGRLDIELEDKMYTLGEVTVTAGKRKNVEDVQMGVQKLAVQELKTIPTAFGELDILRIVQTLPGVKTMGEASGGFNVRGGATDQNLILFNENTVFNPTHLFGFFSAFNGNVLDDMELYKSSIPPKYGGRISSVLNVNSRKGDKEEYHGEVSLGLLTSSFNIEGPLKKKKTSFLLSGRTTYSDWILGIIPEKSGYKNGKAGFYDANALISHQFNSRNHLYLNGYYSYDRFNFVEEEKYNYTNINASMKWVHLFKENFRSSVSMGYDHYDYATENYANENDAYKMSFDINQYFLKSDFEVSGLKGHTLNWGVNGILYDVLPGKVLPATAGSLRNAQTMQKENALETAIYANEEWEITKRLMISAGVRYSWFSALGPRTYRTYTEGELPTIHNVVDTVAVEGSKNLKTYHGAETRLSMRYNLLDNFSIKAGYNTMRQYIHKVSNTMVMSPTDTWKLSDMHIKPQLGEQYSAGLYLDLMDGGIETSVEAYYKKLQDYLDYRSGAQLLMNPHLETDVIPTEGRAYGVEFMVKKPSGKLNGWLSYTYSRTELRQSDSRIEKPVNDGEWYPAEYDKPHEVKLVGNYQFTKRYSASLNFDYSTGRPQTMPVSKYYDHTVGAPSFFYTNRNEVRIPDYMRMDVSFNIKPSHKLTAKTHRFFTVGIYNLLGRKNVYSIYFKNEGDEGVKGYRMSIFGAPIPFVSYNIKF
ncbi:MAG: TonB-dependent receptor [Bacteroidaceae bacterium]|nr:TonB-dependent receptor [Bacteroidaceae bacterium]